MITINVTWHPLGFSRRPRSHEERKEWNCNHADCITVGGRQLIDTLQTEEKSTRERPTENRGISRNVSLISKEFCVISNRTYWGLCQSAHGILSFWFVELKESSSKIFSNIRTLLRWSFSLCLNAYEHKGPTNSSCEIPYCWRALTACVKSKSTSEHNFPIGLGSSL